MSTTSALLNRISSPTLPDSAQLGGRMFITDGVNPNLVMINSQQETRPMGCQAVAEAVAALDFGAGLTGNATYTYGVRRVLTQGALEITSGMRTVSLLTKFLLFAAGATVADDPTDWDAIADGEFAITIGGTSHDITALDFSATHGSGAVTTMDAVAARIQVGIRAATTSNEIVVWDPIDADFLVKSTTGAITAIAAVSGGSGTDISITGLMNGVGGAAIQEHRYETGTTTADTVASWTAIADGAFDISVNAVDYEVTGIDLSATHADGAAADMDAVAARIQVRLRVATSGSEHVEWEAANSRFFLRSTVGTVLAPSVPASGTDLSPKAYMNAPGGQSLSGECQANILLETYDYTLPSWVTVGYEIWRSKAAAPTTLYRLATLTEAERAALTDDLYPDSTADSALVEDSAGTFSTSTGDLLATVPPVRYVRAWKGALVMGGSYAYEEGTVSGTDGSDQLTLASPGECSPADVGAYLAVTDEPQTFIVLDVDVTAGVYTLDKPLTMDHAANTYVRFRDFDAVYITQQLPANIELYSASAGVVYSNAGDNDPVSGIAAANDWCYILRRDRVEMLTGSPAAAAIIQHPAGLPGCASHATIADRNSKCPAVLYYAGQAGVIMMAGSEAKHISLPLQGLLESRVDHSMNGYAHGVYDPRFRLYYLWLFETGWQTRVGPRVPDLLLTYSLDHDDWCVSRLAASRSGLWRRADGERVPVIGIGGGVAYLDLNYADGEQYSGTVTAATATDLDDSAADFTATGSGLAGFPIVVYHADGTTQERLIQRNTATRIVPYVAFDPVPAAADRYRIGAIPWSVTFEDIALGAGESEIPFEDAVTVDRVAILHQLGTATDELQAVVRRTAWDLTRDAATMERDADLSNRHITVLAGKHAGIRAQGLRLELSGETSPAAIRAVAMILQRSSK